MTPDEDGYPPPIVVIRACLIVTRMLSAHDPEVCLSIDGYNLTINDLIRALNCMSKVAQEPDFSP